MTDLAEVTFARHGAVVVATLTGEIDVYNAAQIGAELQAAVTPAMHALIVDLQGIEFLDSTAILQLFTLRTALAERRQELRVVVSEDGVVQRTLALVDFARAAPVMTDLDAALADVAGRA